MITINKTSYDHFIWHTTLHSYKGTTSLAQSLVKYYLWRGVYLDKFCVRKASITILSFWWNIFFLLFCLRYYFIFKIFILSLTNRNIKKVGTFLKTIHTNLSLSPHLLFLYRKRLRTLKRKNIIFVNLITSFERDEYRKTENPDRDSLHTL